jgi:YVTN family beta-propeller protein
VSNGRGASVSVIDTASNRVAATIGVGQRPWNMAWTADGAKLYVANRRSNSVSVIDTRLGSRIADIAVGESPWGVALR